MKPFKLTLKRKLIRLVSATGCCLLAATSYAQLGCGAINTNVPSAGIINGTFIQEHVPTRRVVPLAPVREADVAWSKRVWRSIDLRQKLNHPLYYPMDDFSGSGYWITNAERHSLWTIFRLSVLCGDLTLFDPENPYALGSFDGDQFKYPVRPEPGKNYYSDKVYRENALRFFGELTPQAAVCLRTVSDEDSSIVLPDGTIALVYPPRDTLWYTSKDIVAYRLKEDWFFDKQRSVMDVRILGISPVVHQKDKTGQITGTRELFWLYFPHCRMVLNNFMAFNTQNDAQWMSYDDLFQKRIFASIIYKESNVFDRSIESYRSGVDALMESEMINDEIRNVEHDVWNY